MNTETAMTLDDAVVEVLSMLTGLDLSYDPVQDRYRTITRQLNRALRANALEQEWGYYSSVLELGKTVAGTDSVLLPSNARPRIINDDAVQLRRDGLTVAWAFFLPRESLPKYNGMPGLWCSITRQELKFSRRLYMSEHHLDVHVPVMREPRMFRLPESGEEVPDSIRRQLVDFDYPDVIIARAAYLYAQTDPVMQPRAQTLEAGYKDLMYQVMERDSRMTDFPYLNGFRLPLENGLINEDTTHRHPHSDF